MELCDLIEKWLISNKEFESFKVARYKLHPVGGIIYKNNCTLDGKILIIELDKIVYNKEDGDYSYLSTLNTQYIHASDPDFFEKLASRLRAINDIVV